MAYTYAGTYGPSQIIDPNGHPITGLQVGVYVHGNNSFAPLYTDRTKAHAAANPTSVDGIGNLAFFVDPGEYDVVSSRGSFTVQIYPDPAEPFTGDLNGTVPSPTLQNDSNVQTVVLGVLAAHSSLPMFDLKNTYGAHLDGIHDDTAAVQAAVDAAYAAGGGRIVGSGVALMSSAATAIANNGSGATNKACVHLDKGGAGASWTATPIVFEGQVPGRPPLGSVIATEGVPGTYGLILYANPTEAQSGSGSQKAWAISAGDGAGAGFQNVTLGFKNATVRVPKGGSYGGINAGYCVGVDWEGLTVGTDAAPTALNTNATVGYQTPYYENGAWSRLHRVHVFGFATNAILEEHVDGDGLSSVFGTTAFLVHDAPHAIRIGRVLTFQVQTVWGFNPINGINAIPIDVQQWDHEDDTGTFATTSHISDSGNIAYGSIKMTRVTAGVGTSTSYPIVTGAEHLTIDSTLLGGGSAFFQNVVGGVGYTNGWTDLGGGITTKFRKDSTGRVELQLGAVSPGGAAGNRSAFTLPVGFRPGQTVLQAMAMYDNVSAYVIGVLDISTTGLVQLATVAIGTPPANYQCVGSYSFLAQN